MADMGILRPEVFVSYSSSDQALVERLVADLAKHGVTLWFAPWAMKPGDRLLPKITEGIRFCKYFGVVVSRASLESPWVTFELDAAMIRYIEDKNIRIIPILIDDVDPTEMPIALRGFVFVDLRKNTPDLYRERLRQLVDAIVLPQPTAEPAFECGSIRSPDGNWLENALLALATDPALQPTDQDDLRSKWPMKYCRANRSHIISAVDYLIGQHYSDSSAVQDLIQCLHAIFSTHQLTLRNIPPQMVRVIDDDSYDEEARAVAVRTAGLLDYPLGEERLGRLLSRKWGKIVYSVCEYVEFRVGTLDSEDLAERLLAVLNRPDSFAYFSTFDHATGDEVEADVRYYAARCLALADLSPHIEEIIVDMVRKKYSEVEDEVMTILLNSVALGALDGAKSRLWKRFSGKLESVFQRVDASRERA